MAVTRHKIRELAFQTLFAVAANPDVDQANLMHSLLGTEDDTALPVYLETLVQGVCAKQATLDDLIAQHLNQNWSLKRLAKTDVTILRMAIFEMLDVDNVPGKVAVNEALELAKEYSDERSRRFINGVLSAVLREQTTSDSE
ncbi:transcription antitermination factor NusB [Loigolactobacillus bifermentans]|uniref:transcription antitermination factor NusB n=1 Tax=Loigolactobacillus bifermentans TaxID=1607 RepID=UPI0007107A49|nr:transcription antitermination factor NusB [Loigolactobacillus bifermentans]QGG59519.1 transcription antitermination factor NusB [Loigolactobacillus bifermentans]